ncbi:MAG: putative Ig domain-containing protein, partial [Microscillaceae bacterium]|nr:putative Ig domain-containing protein [Microscillaceae bacterium]
MAVLSNNPYAIDQATGLSSAPLRVRVENQPPVVTPSLVISPISVTFNLVQGTTGMQLITVNSSDGSTLPTPAGITLIDLTTNNAPTWLATTSAVNQGVQYELDANTTSLATGTYIAQLIAGPVAGYENDTILVTLNVSPVASNPVAELQINGTSGDFFASTFGGGSMVLTNTGNQNIVKVTIDMESAFLPDIVFDPEGLAGDAVAKPLQISSVGGTGYITPANAAIDPFSKPQNGTNNQDGFLAMTLNFNDFNPGEAITFSVDIDPTSIKSDPNSGNAGSVSGFELIGSVVTVQLQDGSILTGSLFDNGSNGGSKAVIYKPDGLTVPTVALQGSNASQVIVTTANQVINITGAPNSTVTLLRGDGRLQLDDDGVGYDIDAFEANEIIAKQVYNVTLDASGNASVPVTLTQTTSPGGGNAGPNGGLNHFIAVTKGTNGQISVASQVLVVLFDPAGANLPPVVQNPGNQTNESGSVINLPIVAEDGDANAQQTLTYIANGLPPGLSINSGTGLITGTIGSGTGSFQEQSFGGQTGGLFIAEMESASSQINNGWQQGTSGSITYLQGTANSTGNPNSDQLSYNLNITQPGVYRFIWRNAYTGSSSTDANDSWLKVNNTSSVVFFGQQGTATEQGIITAVNGNASNIVYPIGSGLGGAANVPEGTGGSGYFKIYRAGGASGSFDWDANTSDNDPHGIYVWVKQPQTITVIVSNRSAGHQIDRFALFSVAKYGQGFPGGFENLTNLPQSTAGAGGEGTYNVDITVLDNGTPPAGASTQFIWNVTVPSQNTLPTANAGADQTVTDSDNNGSQAVSLNGAASTDADGTIVSYVWTENGAQIA